MNGEMARTSTTNSSTTSKNSSKNSTVKKDTRKTEHDGQHSSKFMCGSVKEFDGTNIKCWKRKHSTDEKCMATVPKGSGPAGGFQTIYWQKD